jgi:hypothetical protein
MRSNSARVGLGDWPRCAGQHHRGTQLTRTLMPSCQLFKKPQAAGARTLRQIAAALNGRGVATAREGKRV